MVCISIYIFTKIAQYIQLIYADYGERFYTVCFIPFISSIIYDIVISVNVILVILCLIAYKFGDIYLRIKTRSISSRLFKIIVPLKIRKHHKIIMKFRDFYQVYNSKSDKKQQL
jgi:hypothetical protein